MYWVLFLFDWLFDYLVEFHFIHSAMDISIDCTTNLKFQFLRLINFEINSST